MLSLENNPAVIQKVDQRNASPRSCHQPTPTPTPTATVTSICKYNLQSSLSLSSQYSISLISLLIVHLWCSVAAEVTNLSQITHQKETLTSESSPHIQRHNSISSYYLLSFILGSSNKSEFD